MAGKILREGSIVAFPTETVYGLGVNAHNSDVIKIIYEIKKRPGDKALTIHIAELEKLEKLTDEISPLAEKLMERFSAGAIDVNS